MFAVYLLFALAMAIWAAVVMRRLQAPWRTIRRLRSARPLSDRRAGICVQGSLPITQAPLTSPLAAKPCALWWAALGERHLLSQVDPVVRQLQYVETTRYQFHSQAPIACDLDDGHRLIVNPADAALHLVAGVDAVSFWRGKVSSGATVHPWRTVPEFGQDGPFIWQTFESSAMDDGQRDRVKEAFKGLAGWTFWHGVVDHPWRVTERILATGRQVYVNGWLVERNGDIHLVGNGTEVPILSTLTRNGLHELAHATLQRQVTMLAIPAGLLNVCLFPVWLRILAVAARQVPAFAQLLVRDVTTTVVVGVGVAALLPFLVGYVVLEVVRPTGSEGASDQHNQSLSKP